MQASLDTMHRAIKAGDVDTLCSVLEKPADLWETLHLLDTLPRAKQIALLIRVWHDEKIVKPAPVDNFYDPAGLIEINKQDVLERKSYRLLGENPPTGHGELTRAEMDALAARLQAIQ